MSPTMTDPYGGRPIGDAVNDPRVPCCGRDAADCDCPPACGHVTTWQGCPECDPDTEYPSVMVVTTARWTGTAVATCPTCGAVCAYWTEDDCDDEGRLWCDHGEEHDEDDNEPAWPGSRCWHSDAGPDGWQGVTCDACGQACGACCGWGDGTLVLCGECYAETPKCDACGRFAEDDPEWPMDGDGRCSFCVAADPTAPAPAPMLATCGHEDPVGFFAGTPCARCVRKAHRAATGR